MQHTRQARRPDYPIEQIFYQRWSPRAFSDELVSERDLLTALEAARWAPSSFNSQPWRFLYARNGDAWWHRYLDTLNAFNRVWAQRAGAIVVTIRRVPRLFDLHAVLGAMFCCFFQFQGSNS